jgi:hypothetical protein
VEKWLTVAEKPDFPSIWVFEPISIFGKSLWFLMKCFSSETIGLKLKPFFSYSPKVCCLNSVVWSSDPMLAGITFVTTYQPTLIFFGCRPNSSRVFVLFILFHLLHRFLLFPCSDLSFYFTLHSSNSSNFFLMCSVYSINLHYISFFFPYFIPMS